MQFHHRHKRKTKWMDTNELEQKFYIIHSFINDRQLSSSELSRLVGLDVTLTPVIFQLDSVGLMFSIQPRTPHSEGIKNTCSWWRKHTAKLSAARCPLQFKLPWPLQSSQRALVPSKNQSWTGWMDAFRFRKNRKKQTSSCNFRAAKTCSWASCLSPRLGSGFACDALRWQRSGLGLVAAACYRLCFWRPAAFYMLMYNLCSEKTYMIESHII